MINVFLRIPPNIISNYAAYVASLSTDTPLDNPLPEILSINYNIYTVAAGLYLADCILGSDEDLQTLKSRLPQIGIMCAFEKHGVPVGITQTFDSEGSEQLSGSPKYPADLAALNAHVPDVLQGEPPVPVPKLFADDTTHGWGAWSKKRMDLI